MEIIIRKTKAEKMQKEYCVRPLNIEGCEMKIAVKDVDIHKRIVTGILNTLYWFDKDYDVLIDKVANNSISQHGPTKANAVQIKFAMNHDLTKRPGKFTVLDQRKIDGHDVIYFEAKVVETTLGNDTLIDYQEGLIDNHSIGFRYLDLEFIENEAEKWKFYVDQLINPQDAEDIGFMWVVKEIMLWEGSGLGGFGANELTPYLGVKSGNKDHIMLKIFNRIDKLDSQLKSGTQSDETMNLYQLQVMQLKQIIRELVESDKKPSEKDTYLINRPSEPGTLKAEDFIINLK